MKPDPATPLSSTVVSPWRDLCVPPTSLRLGPTLLSGMSFRWRHRHGQGSYANKAHSEGYLDSLSLLDGSYIGVLRDTIFEAREDDQTVWFRVHNPRKEPAESAEAALRAHFSLGRGVDAASWTGLPTTPVQFRKAAAALPGVRCLSILSHVEALVTFVGSANNNIKRNMQMVAALCAEFPSNLLGTDAYGEASILLRFGRSACARACMGGFNRCTTDSLQYRNSRPSRRRGCGNLAGGTARRG